LKQIGWVVGHMHVVAPGDGAAGGVAGEDEDADAGECAVQAPPHVFE
jgi:hypothetical protein